MNQSNTVYAKSKKIGAVRLHELEPFLAVLRPFTAAQIDFPSANLLICDTPQYGVDRRLLGVE